MILGARKKECKSGWNHASIINDDIDKQFENYFDLVESYLLNLKMKKIYTF